MSDVITIGAYQYPSDLVEAVAIEAAVDGDRLVAFLADLGVKGDPHRPVRLPAEAMLNLASGLRLLGWEAQGYRIHLDSGLPEAMTVLRNALLSLSQPECFDYEIDSQVLALSIEKFAWAARTTFGAEILLGELEADDSAAEAIANFLWASRPTPHSTTEP